MSPNSPSRTSDAALSTGANESSTPVEFTIAWAVCPVCGECWTSDIDADTEWPVIREVADECRAHLTATEHAPTFDVGIEP